MAEKETRTQVQNGYLQVNCLELNLIGECVLWEDLYQMYCVVLKTSELRMWLWELMLRLLSIVGRLVFVLQTQKKENFEINTCLSFSQKKKKKKKKERKKKKNERKKEQEIYHHIPFQTDKKKTITKGREVVATTSLPMAMQALRTPNISHIQGP